MLVIDLHMVGLMAKRMNIARRVGFAKHRQATPGKPLGADIYREEIEVKRLADVRAEAERLGVYPEFAVAMLYMLIGESCKRQMIQREEGDFEYGEVEYEQLKKNLIALTGLVAETYDDGYTIAHPATAAYLEFEEEVILEEIAETPNTGRALDIGCSTGRTSLLLADHFEHVTGVDISAEMLVQATENATAQGVDNVTFSQGDVEQEEVWRSIEDGSVDFVTMGMGTASDVKELRKVLGEIERVLPSEGRCVLSFYNAEALHVQAGFFPWPNTLAAVVDPSRHCLDVWAKGKTYSVYARAYTPVEIDGLWRRRMQSTVRYSHPTFAAMLPREMLFEDSTRTAIMELDRERARSSGNDGAYILAVGRKG